MIDDILAVLDEAKQVFAELIIDGEIVTTDRMAIAMSAIVQLEARLIHGEEDLEDDQPGVSSIDVLTRNLSAKPQFSFADIHHEVLSAVYSACDSAEDNALDQWELDLIESRIVEHHGGKKLLKSSPL